MEDFEQVVKILNNHSAAMEILVKNSMETTPKLEALEYNMMHHDKLSVRLEKRLGDVEKRLGDFEKRIKGLEVSARINEAAYSDRLREEKPAARPEAKNMESRVDQMDARIRDLEPSIGRGQVSGKKQIMNFPEEKDEAQSCSRYAVPSGIVPDQKGTASHISAPVFKSPIAVPPEKHESVNPRGPSANNSVPAQVPPVLVKVPPVLVKVPPVLVKVPHVPVQVPPVPAQAVTENVVLPSTHDFFSKKDRPCDGVVHQTLGGFGRARAYRGVNPTNVANVVRPRVEVSQPGAPVAAFSSKEENSRGMRGAGLGFGRNFGRYQRRG